jgi:hypothetical protein
LVDDFYPVGGAANYSLLYSIFRIAKELRPSSVLDIGAGQSSVLWSRLVDLGWVRKLLTVEDNERWAETIRAQVRTEVLCSPLSRQAIDGRQVMSYDWSKVGLHGPFDVVVCDGPRGVPRYSRYGVVSLLEKSLSDDFVVVVDDAERVGERDTVHALVQSLSRLGRTFELGIVKARKSQILIAGGAYASAIFVGDRVTRI